MPTPTDDSTSPSRIQFAQATINRIFDLDVAVSVQPYEPPSFGELREMFTEHAYADSWSRTAVDDKTRSMLTVAIVAAIGAEAELAIHLDGALRIGVTADELADVLAQVSVYAGVPRAGTALRMLSKNLARRADSGGSKK